MIKHLFKKLFNLIPNTGEKLNYQQGLRIKHTIVHQDFLQSNPTWDKHLFNNIQIIK